MQFLLFGCNTLRLVFREISPTDFDSWLKFFEHPETSKHWVEEEQTPAMACEKWYARQQERYQNNLGGMNALIEKSSGLLVGHAGLLLQTVDDRTELEIGYSLLPQFWGNGFAIEAAQKCKQVAFQNRYAPSLISIISISNLPSQRVAEKNGLRRDGQTIYKHNSVYIYRITRAEYDFQTLA
jgi:RimJ/RimL family protein N-acetyltransferase